MPSNTMTYDDLVATAQELGRQNGQGQDAQAKLLLKTIEASYHGVIDLKANKHGAEIDDAVKITEHYVKARQGNVIFDHKAPNQRKTASCVRTAVKLGSWTKGGSGEPIATVNNLMTLRQKMKKNPAEAKKLDDAFNTIVRFARAQLKQDTLIPDKALADFCYKASSTSLPTAEDIIEGLVKKLDHLIAGTAAQSTVQDYSPEVRAARDELRKRLTAIAVARAPVTAVTATVSP